jgi:hypothetical protein
MMGVEEGAPPTYPADRIPLFRYLEQLRLDGKISAGKFDTLKDVFFTADIIASLIPRADHSSDNGEAPGSAGEIARSSQFTPRTLVSSTQVQNSAVGADLEAMMQRAFTAALRQHHAETAAEAPDAVLSVQKAAELLSCRPEQVCRHIKPIPGRRGKYSAAAVQAKIADWLKLNGGPAKHYELLRRAVADFQGAEDALLGERAQAVEAAGKVSQEEAATMVEDLTLSHNP